METGLWVDESGKVKEKMELLPDRLGDTEFLMRSRQINMLKGQGRKNLQESV